MMKILLAFIQLTHTTYERPLCDVCTYLDVVVHTLSSTTLINGTSAMVWNRHRVAIGRIVTVSPVLLSDLVDSTVTLIAVPRNVSF